MTPARLSECLDALGWGVLTLARRRGVAESTVRGWRAGRSPVPESVASWLEKLAKLHTAHPQPRGWEPPPPKNAPPRDFSACARAE